MHDAFLLVAMMFCASGCLPVRTPVQGAVTNSLHRPAARDPLVVLVDDSLPLYDQVITGIHVASGGDYRVLRLHEEGFVQSALLEDLLSLKPQALIALGPRSANAISSARVILPSAFSMVPRLENYELDNVFCGGIRMVPDTKERIGLVRSLLPNLRALGVMFSRQNSRNSMQRIRTLCDDEQFELVNIEVQSVSDVLPALMRYHQEFGAVLMLDDPILLDVTVLRSVTTYLASKGIAFFGLDCSMVQEGALASFGTNFFSLGRELVDMVTKDKGAHRYQTTDIVDPKEKDLCINLATTRHLPNANDFINRVIDYAGEKKIALRVFN